MPTNSEINDGSSTCRINVVSAGLPHRGTIILQREINLFPLMVDRLMGRGKTHGERAAETVEMQALEEAFAGQVGGTLLAAGFLAGRCEPDSPEQQERLTRLLQDFLDSLDVDDLGVMEEAHVQAAMSLALRGEPDQAHERLASLFAGDGPSLAAGYLAAFYLAQMGDASGYPKMVESLHSGVGHYRLMAVRHLIAFKPYDGQAVQGEIVDVGGQLVQRLSDHDPNVRAEVPYHLEEAGSDGIRDLLAPVMDGDESDVVREAARSVLERLEVK